YSFTVEGKIEESGVEAALEELRALFAQYISDGRDSVTIALTDSAPDLSVLNEILTAEDIKVILDLSQCTGLTEIGVSGASNSSTDAFQKCENLLSVRLPDSVEKINSYAFYKCTSLTRIILPDSLSAFEKGAFCYCESLGNVILPSGITEISDYLFWNTRLGGITIPASVTSIGKCAFWQCSALYYVSLESSTNLTSIGINAFTECTNLHDISLPESLETIGKEAFCGCTAIESIVIPDSVKEIGLRAFAGCENLSSINLKADDDVLWNVYEGIYNADSNSFTESDASSSQISTLSLKSDARLTSTSTADAIKLIRSE
ncbi:MAG: leucine-rich repeat protein, partial [Treponema sp.]|nr:leucine-rich repeat protein [Treponema sp.]